MMKFEEIYRAIRVGLLAHVAAGLLVLTPSFSGETAENGKLGLETVLPVQAERDAYKPCVAFANDAYLVAWQSGRLAPGDLRKGLNFVGDIVGCRVDKNGKSIDAKPFVICEATDLQEQPQAASNGKTIMIVWQDLRNGKDWDVYAARITPDGNVLDKNGFLVAGGAHNQALPRITWDGKTFVVVWQDFRSNKRYEVFGARVGADGKVIDSQGFAISSSEGIKWAKVKVAHRFSPTVASAGGGRSYVYWVGRSIKKWGSGQSGGDLVVDGKPSWAYRFTPDDNLTGERIKLKTGGPIGCLSPVSLAAGKMGEEEIYMSAWQTYIPYSRSRGGPLTTNAALYDKAGKRTKPVNIRGGGGMVISPEICWDGSAFVAAWDEVKKVVGRGKHGKYNVAYTSRISPKGAVTGKAQLLSGTFDSPAHEAAVGSDGTGTSLVAYEKHPKTADVPIKIAFRMLTIK